jgi:hypothetical protein
MSIFSDHKRRSAGVRNPLHGVFNRWGHMPANKLYDCFRRAFLELP